MTATFGQDSFANPIKYAGQNYQFSAVFIRRRDPRSPQSQSPDVKPGENIGYYPLASFWINTLDRRIWVLRGINNNLGDWIQITSGGGGGGVLSLTPPNGGTVFPDGAGDIQFTDPNSTITMTNAGTAISFDATPVLSKLIFNLPASGPTVSPVSSVVNLRSNGTVAITRTDANTINFAATAASAMTNVRTLFTYVPPPDSPIATPVVVTPNVLNNINFQSDNNTIFIEGDSASNTVYLDAQPVLSNLGIAVPPTFVGTDVIPTIDVAAAQNRQWTFVESGGMEITGIRAVGRVTFNSGPANSANRFVTDAGTATPTVVAHTGTLNVLGIGSLQTSAPGSTDILKIKEPNCALFIVDPNIDYGTHSTIQSAINAAAIAGGHRTVFIRPGTYTENLTLAANVNLTAFECDSRSQTVKIKGLMTYGLAGNCGITGIYLETNGDYLLHQTAGTLTFENCFFNALTHTAMLLTGGSIDFFSCQSEIRSPATTLFVATTNADIYMESCFWANGVGSQEPITMSDCFFACTYCTFTSPIITSGYAVFGAGYSGFMSGIGMEALTFGGTGQHTLRYCYIYGSIYACLKLNAGNITLTHEVQMNTSNTNIVIGAGEWRYGGITWEGGATGASVATQTPWTYMGPRTMLAGGAQLISGTGSPAGSVTAPKGSFFLRTDGSSSTTRAYINTNAGTGWTAVMTVS